MLSTATSGLPFFSLNESPSKRKGNLTAPAPKYAKNHASMKPLQKGREIQTALGAIANIAQASMKALPKRKGNVRLAAHFRTVSLRASMKALPKRKGNVLIFKVTQAGYVPQ